MTLITMNESEGDSRKHERDTDGSEGTLKRKSRKLTKTKAKSQPKGRDY